MASTAHGGHAGQQAKDEAAVAINPVDLGSGLIDSLLQGHDEREALILGDSVVTRARLRRAASETARALSSLGLRRGDALALWLPNGAAWIELLCAAAHLGVLVVPISTRYKPAEVRHLLEVSRARCIVAPVRFLDQPYAEMARGLMAEVPSLQRVIECIEPQSLLDWPGEMLHARAESTGQGGDLLCCFSTSGTTGFPKLAAHGHASIVRHAHHVARALDIRVGDAVLCALPLFGVFGFMTALAALAGGASCVLVPVFDATDAAQRVERQRITHVIGADSMFDAMLNVPATNWTSLRRGVQADFVGLTLSVTERADARGVRFSGTYGSSECYSLMVFQPWHAPASQRALAGGMPVDPLIEFRIVDPQTGINHQDSEPGELQIRGPNVLAEYLNNPQATAQAFAGGGWFRTGDLARREGSGFVYLARMGDSLRLRGFLVNPAEIEQVLMQHPTVSGAQVVGVNEPGQGDIAVAYVTLNKGAAPPQEADLLAHCRERMAAYKLPRRILAIDDFPAINGPNGNKIQKRVLRDMARDALGLNRPHA